VWSGYEVSRGDDGSRRQDADIKDVFRLLADVGKVNLVVPTMSAAA